MTPTSRIDGAKLSVLLDIRHPLAYLALHPAIALGQDLDIEINWLPLVVPPLSAPSKPGPKDDRGLRHRRSRAEAIAREVDTYAAAQGLVVRDYYRHPEPAGVNLAWLWLRKRHPGRVAEFLIEAFRAYWAVDLDPADPAAVAGLLDSLGADGSKFRDWCFDEGPSTAALLAKELSGRGLFGVPAYVIEDEVLLGRQHLPMIRWILEGRTRAGPI